MQILMINYEFPPVGGGAGRATQNISKELVKMGAHVTVLTSAGKNITGNTVIDGVHIHFIKTHRKSVHHTGMFAVAEFLIKGMMYAKRLIFQNKYDLIHYFFSIPTGLLSFSLNKKIPYIVSLRGGDVPEYISGEVQYLHQVMQPLNRTIWRGASDIVALSHDLGKVAKIIEPERDYRVIYNGVDTDRFKPSSHAKQNRLEIQLLSVCRLLPWKGLQYLLTALQLIDNQRIHLTIVGTGHYEQVLKKQTVASNLTNRVSFVGAIAHEQLPEIYNQADIFVLPSFGDSFGQVFTEAMACGLPVIAARHGGVQEFVEDGINGFLVPPHDSNTLAIMIDRLAVSPKLRTTMRENNIQKVKSHFSWYNIAKQYKGVYKQVLQ